MVGVGSEGGGRRSSGGRASVVPPPGAVCNLCIDYDRSLPSRIIRPPRISVLVSPPCTEHASGSASLVATRRTGPFLTFSESDIRHNITASVHMCRLEHPPSLSEL